MITEWCKRSGTALFLTVGSVLLIVMLAAGVAFVVQRRNDRVATVVSTLMLTGLIIPPAVVPTIFVLQEIGLYKTIIGLIFVEVGITLPFAVLILRAFMASIPREIDEAAIIDGASPFQLFFLVVFPLLRPAIITIIVVSAVVIYNDFTLPLYFLPGSENVTAQLTLFSFISQFFIALGFTLCRCNHHYHSAACDVYVLPTANCRWTDIRCS